MDKDSNKLRGILFSVFSEIDVFQFRLNILK